MENFKERVIELKIYVELYKLGKATLIFGVVFYLTKLLALLPLEFKVVERLESSKIEVEYYGSRINESDKNHINGYKLLVANGVHETASREKDEIVKVTSAITSLMWTALKLGGLFLVLSLAAWVLLPIKVSDAEKDKAGE